MQPTMPVCADRPGQRRARRIAAAPLAALVLAGLAACGSSGTTAAPNVLRAARNRTIAAGSARLHARAVLTGTGAHGTGVIRLSEDGVTDFARDATSESAVASGTGRLQVVIIGRDWYQRPAGRRTWLRLRVADAGSQAGTAANGTSPLSPGDPAEILTYLNYPATSVTRVGTEHVGGVATVHYRAVLKNGDYGTIPADVWVDGQGRIRQAGVTLLEALPAPTASAAPGSASGKPAAPSGRRGSLHLTVAFWDFGAPARVSQPPAAQVTGH